MLPPTQPTRTLPGTRARLAARATRRRHSYALGALLSVVLALPHAFAQTCATADELAAAERVRAHIAAHGVLAWPGWTSPPPVLLRTGDVDCLLDHPAPPAAFVREAPGVHRLDGHVLPVPAATAYDVGGTWTLVVPARDELQAFLDEHLGPGVVDIDDALYQRTLLHEAFHAHQMTLVGGIGSVPTFADDGVPAAHPGEPSAALNATHAEQGRALHDALHAATAGDAVAAVERFLAAREAWRDHAPAGTAAGEQQLEWLEGTARYADVLLALYPEAATTDAVDPGAWSHLLAQVRDPVAIPSGTRDRYAALGAAQAFLLDRLHPGWKRLAIPDGASLESLLRDVVAGRAGVPASLRGLELHDLELDGRSWRLAVADTPEAWGQGLRDVTHLGAIDGVWFRFPEDVDAAFWMRGARLPLDIAFLDAGGSTRRPRRGAPLRRPAWGRAEACAGTPRATVPSASVRSREDLEARAPYDPRPCRRRMSPSRSRSASSTNASSAAVCGSSVALHTIISTSTG